MAVAEPQPAEERSEPPELGATKELRLAVVCYGGVSLAIYMHGQTKELNRLVSASRRLDEDAAAGATGSEAVYLELLGELAAAHPDRVRTRVVVDVVAGTSAGGINGVYLAKAVAHNRSQDELRNLWLERGDIGGLIRGRKFIPWQVRGAVRALLFRRGAPLHGDLMSVWIYEALEGMDRQRRAPGDPETLLPELQTLELFVTTTDFHGYNRDVILTDPDPRPERPPQPISDWRHRHVLRFRYGDGRDDFGANDNPALAFAARATSSFPGAFPPVSFDAFAGYLRGKGVRFTPELADKYFRHYGLSGASPQDAQFIDGGVLDNKPFGHAIAAIRGKHASTEVDRRLVYLEPDPGEPGPPRQGEPGTIPTVLGAVSGIPRKEPLLEDLLEVARHNDRVRRVRDVIEMSFSRIAKRVEKELPMPLDRVPPDLDAATLGEWTRTIHASAQEEAGFGYATYVRLKIVDVVDRYARAVCAASNFPDDCNQAFFVRTVLRTWATDRGLLEKERSPTEEQEAFLRDFDLEYRKRRLHFAIAGLNWLYRDRALDEEDLPERHELDRVKRRLYEAVRRLDDAVRGIRRDDALRERVRACFDADAIDRFVREEGAGFDPARYAEQHAAELDRLQEQLGEFLRDVLGDFTATLYADVDELTRSWPPRRRRDLLVRWLGFAYWDVLLYPLQALAEVGERDHVQVLRMSPKDAELLQRPGEEGEQKLAGVGLHHFGAFFTREGRENDYLWGRLDGAERLIEVLLGRDHPRFREWCLRAFEQILEEEAAGSPPLADAVLAKIRPRVAALRSA